MPNRTAVALACLIALAPFAGATAPRVESQPYYGGNDVLRLTQTDNVCVMGPHTVHQLDNVGGVCFVPRATDKNVSIDIQDVTGLKVGGLLSFSTTTGLYSSQRFCDQVNAPIPANTFVISVVVDGPNTAPYDCPLGSGGVGTTGQVVATFT